MYVYAVTGFGDPDHCTDWEIYGIYTSRKKAEDRLIELAHDRISELKKRDRSIENCIDSWYNKETNELMSIYDFDNEFFFTIYKRELIGE